jgi:hypothetical protein
VCEFLHITPKQLGQLRLDDPKGIEFIERHIIWKIEQEIEAYKDAERKRKSKSGRGRIR